MRDHQYSPHYRDPEPGPECSFCREDADPTEPVEWVDEITGHCCSGRRCQELLEWFRFGVELGRQEENDKYEPKADRLIPVPGEE